MMGYEFATYEKEGRIAVVTINRPDRMNALHPPANLELHEIWNDFERDQDIWVGILTGAGDKAFSAGNDLRFTAEHGRDMVRAAETGFGGLTKRTTCVKPIIAAVNGYALGGGFEMALACDIIIAAEEARVGLPEVRVGLMAGAGGVHRLPRMIPEKIAMGYLLTGRHMTAQEAHRLGVVNEVVPRAQVMATANDNLLPRLMGDAQLARFWKHRPADSVRREKQLLIDFLCSAAGGPLYYVGRDMTTSHQGMGITESDWLVFTKHVVATFDAFKVPERERGEVLSFVESLKKDIVD
jgi:crotonobetainyl-CoA hydratase